MDWRQNKWTNSLLSVWKVSLARNITIGECRCQDLVWVCSPYAHSPRPGEVMKVISVACRSFDVMSSRNISWPLAYLTHRGRATNSDIMLTTFSNAFNGMNFFISFKCLLIVMQDSNWHYFGIGWGNGLAPTRWQAITWKHDCPFQWRIYALPGFDALIKWSIVC